MSTPLYHIVIVIFLSAFINKCLTLSQTVTMSDVSFPTLQGCGTIGGCPVSITVCKFSTPANPATDCETVSLTIPNSDTFTSLTFPPLTLTQSFPCPFDCKMQARIPGPFLVTDPSTETSTRVSAPDTLVEVHLMPFTNVPGSIATVTLTSVVECPAPSTTPIPGGESPESEGDESAEDESANDSEFSRASREAESTGGKQKRDDSGTFYNTLNNIMKRR